MVTFRCPSSTTSICSTPEVESTPQPPTTTTRRTPTTTATTTSNPTLEDTGTPPREVCPGLNIAQFHANIIEYLKAMASTGKRAITWHDETEPGPIFKLDIENPDPKYPGGRLYLSRVFYDGYRYLMAQRNYPWPTVQDFCDEFGVERREVPLVLPLVRR